MIVLQVCSSSLALRSVFENSAHITHLFDIATGTGHKKVFFFVFFFSLRFSEASARNPEKQAAKRVWESD